MSTIVRLVKERAGDVTIIGSGRYARDLQSPAAKLAEAKEIYAVGATVDLYNAEDCDHFIEFMQSVRKAFLRLERKKALTEELARKKGARK